jgi:hypothetical protein
MSELLSDTPGLATRYSTLEDDLHILTLRKLRILVTLYHRAVSNIANLETSLTHHGYQFHIIHTQ